MTATADELAAAKETLYGTAGVRDDLDDAEAEILLSWADGQIERLATTEGDFSQQNRFLRQLLARIDRFIAQRPYLDEIGHSEHIDKLMKALAISGFSDITHEQVLAALPADKANARANLDAILHLLTPTTPTASPAATPPLSDIVAEAAPPLSDRVDEAALASPATEPAVIPPLPAVDDSVPAPLPPHEAIPIALGWALPAALNNIQPTPVPAPAPAHEAPEIPPAPAEAPRLGWVETLLKAIHPDDDTTPEGDS